MDSIILCKKDEKFPLKNIQNLTKWSTVLYNNNNCTKRFLSVTFQHSKNEEEEYSWFTILFVPLRSKNLAILSHFQKWLSPLASSTHTQKWNVLTCAALLCNWFTFIRNKCSGHNNWLLSLRFDWEWDQ